MDSAEKVLGQMMTVLAMTRIRDPLVELDFAAHLIANNIKVTHPKTFNVTFALHFQVLFLRQGTAARKKAQLWADMAPLYNLLSTQLAERMLSVSHGLPRHHPKRVMAVRLASKCANPVAVREFKLQKRDIIMNAQLEIDLLPDLTKVQWGRGQNMGRFVKKSSKFPPTSLETYFNVSIF